MFVNIDIAYVIVNNRTKRFNLDKINIDIETHRCVIIPLKRYSKKHQKLDRVIFELNLRTKMAFE
jgi:hypothetical protein